MKNVFLFVLSLSISAYSHAQSGYFQQEVNYRIEVTLDDKAHTLIGLIEIDYQNNSSQNLEHIWFHFWGNAFSTPESAFGKQKLRSGSTWFFFSGKEDKGHYSGLDFHVNEEKAKLEFDKNHPDIAMLLLPRPLMPGEKITIKTPFVLKIPASFSRLGHVGESYQMTQWFPKPAVFDQSGWHQMPYLDMGEFYSEFGSFDVSITLPENYVVGATGILQSPEEIAFLERKAKETSQMFESGNLPVEIAFPESSTTFKTVRYKAENVHDFAWFADKRFHVQKSSVTLPSGRKVDTWTMFTNEQSELWKKSIDYVNRSVQFYSELVGEYPYTHATAVQSALSAGAGMEYPMITVIGKASSPKDLDQVITHEVGHNWFYGILASNERDHPWMDEGINSFYEYRYTTKYYGDRVVEALPSFLRGHGNTDLYETIYLFQARKRMDQAPETSSNDFGLLNYGLSSYMKPGFAFGHLMAYLSAGKFDAIMKEFYEVWKFKHPQPSDLKSHFEEKTGKNLDWMFEAYLGSNKHLDYAIETLHKDELGNWIITVLNKGEIAAPFPVSGFKSGKIISTHWFEAIPPGEKQTINLPGEQFDKVVLDAGHITLDVYRSNNHYKTEGVLKKTEPLKLKLLGSLEDPGRSSLYWLPIFGLNKYDGLMPGLAFYNAIIPSKKLDFAIATQYGLRSGQPSGMGTVRYNIFPKNEKIKKIEIGINAKTYQFDFLDSLKSESGIESSYLSFRRVSPYLRFDLMRSHTSRFYQTLEFRRIFLQKEVPTFENLPSGFFYTVNTWSNRLINQVKWEAGNTQALNPFRVNLTLEHASYDDAFGIKQDYLKLSFEWENNYVYEHNRAIKTRIFVGKKFQNDSRKNKGLLFDEAFNLTSQGFNDYRFDNYYLGRSEPDGFFARQILLQEGGMKVALGSPYSEGRSNDMVVAFNLLADMPQDLPLKLPLRPYFDIAWYNDARPISSDLTFTDQVWWQGGFSLGDKSGIFGIHFPVISSRNVADLYKQSGRSSLFNRITFHLDLAKLNPWRFMDNFSL